MTAQSRAKRSRSWLKLVIFAGMPIGLVVVTGWNLTRSTALNEGRRAYSRDDFVGGLSCALAHLNRQPWSRDAALLAAKCLSRLDYALQAEPYYRLAGRLELSDLQVRAYGLARGPRPELAIPAFHEILARSPENVTAMRRLAAVLLVQNETDELLALADRLEQVASGSVLGPTLRAVVYHNDNNPQQAVAAFELVLKLDPELHEMPPLFCAQFAEDLVGIGRIEDASRFLTIAVAKTSDPSLMNRLGETYYLRGSLDDAERCFLQAADMAPGDYEAYLNLAKLALARHDQAQALRQLNRARALSPRRYAILYRLGIVYRLLGRTAEADLLEQTIKHLREQSGVQAPASTLNWPRYSL
jgi:tetratricopeptide (TPR) repeat protein